MKAVVRCLACFVRQGARAAMLSTDDPALQHKALNETMRRIQGLSLDASPALLSDVVYAAVREVTGVADPFAALKDETNQHALALLPELRRKIETAADPLHTAIKVALVGNVIDLGIEHPYDLDRDLATILGSDLTVDHYADFARLLIDCRKLLYVCDNSGEIAFDTLLIERLKSFTEIVASVKSGPVINDATMKDAQDVGLCDLVPVIETGAAAVGVDWTRASDEFKRAFDTADIILAKGQGNIETLDERPEEIFFLLKAKCNVIAEALGVREGDTLFLRGRAPRGS